MSEVIVTGAELSNAPRIGIRFVSTGPQVHYVENAVVRTVAVKFRKPAPPELGVTVEIVKEEDAYFARIPELDVAGEGVTADAALRAVLDATRAWLEYLRDETLDLADTLEPQRRYVALLDAPVFSWFRRFDFTE